MVVWILEAGRLAPVVLEPVQEAPVPVKHSRDFREASWAELLTLFLVAALWGLILGGLAVLQVRT